MHAELAEMKNQLNAILIRESQVHYENVEWIFDGEALCCLGIGRRFNLVSGLFERTPQKTLDLYLVFHKQKPHKWNISAFEARESPRRVVAGRICGKK
jgi:hypothetical protein